MTGQPLNPDAAKGRRGLIAALVGMAAAACIVAVLLVLPAAQADPYSRQTLELSGSSEKGGRLFRLNCAGCHGIAVQGLVGPNLHGVAARKSSRQLIQQVVSGRTPPMPRFQPEPQAMADLLDSGEPDLIDRYLSSVAQPMDPSMQHILGRFPVGAPETMEGRGFMVQVGFRLA